MENKRFYPAKTKLIKTEEGKFRPVDDDDPNAEFELLHDLDLDAAPPLIAEMRVIRASGPIIYSWPVS